MTGIDQEGRAETATAVEPEPEGRFVAPAPFAIALGVVILASADPVARILDSILPPAATVRSVGYPYPGFARAYPFALRILGGAMIAAGVVWLVAARARLRPPSARALPTIAVGLFALASFAWIAWLAYPHNAYPDDAHIHWVDIFFGRSDRFFYVLVKPEHWLFYDHPHVAQGLHSALNVLLAAAAGRRLFPGRPWMATAVAGSVAASMLMAVFADGSSDVMLNATLILTVFVLLLDRSKWLGAALFFITLGRPPFVLFAFAVVLTEVLLGVREGERGIRAAWRDPYLRWVVLTFAALFAGWHAFLSLRGLNWILANGRLFDAPHFEIDPENVDGYVASRFGGMFFLHAVWLYPISALVGSVYAAVRLRALPLTVRKGFVAAWLFVLMGVVTQEYLVIKGFTIKYLGYYVPLVIVLGWTALAVGARPRLRAALAGAAVFMMLAPLAAHPSRLDDRDEFLARPLTQLFYDRQELRAMVDPDRLATTIRSRSDRNYMAYVFRLACGRFLEVEPGQAPPGGAVVTRSLAGYEEAEVLWRGDDIFLVAAGRGTVPGGVRGRCPSR